MRIDPVEVLVEYLRNHPEIPSDAPLGDMTEHVTGETCVYLETSGGFRHIRDAEDCAHVEYDVYALDRKACIDLALLVREKLLEELPNTTVAGATILDVEDIALPRYYPDDSSREHMYGGEVAVYFTSA
ncbi:hypothetical protein ACWDWS_02395 [Streptomyces sp. NPDC003328]